MSRPEGAQPDTQDIDVRNTTAPLLCTISATLSKGLHFDITSVSLHLTSMATRLHFQLTSTSLRLNFRFTSSALRFHFRNHVRFLFDLGSHLLGVIKPPCFGLPYARSMHKAPWVCSTVSQSIHVRLTNPLPALLARMWSMALGVPLATHVPPPSPLSLQQIRPPCPNPRRIPGDALRV